MPKLRKNIVTGDWVIISPERSKRPEDYVVGLNSISKPSTTADCPFCIENNNAYKFSIAEAETKNVYVIPNKYAAFVKDDSVISEGDGFYEDTKSIGAHEVIVIKDHNQNTYDKEVIDDLIGVYISRYAHYGQDPVNEYSLIIHNHGPEAGASIEHPHSQLFTSAIMPSYIQKELDGSKKYFDENNKCVYCEIARVEKENGQRMVYENNEFMVFTFFASRFPFEMWIMPKNHASNFEEMSTPSQELLSDALRTAIGRLNKALNFPPFNFWIHTLPYHGEGFSQSYHWHIEIAPRVSKYGGYELGSGVVVDVVSPEMAAEFLKKS